MKITFTVYGEPKAQPRPKAFARKMPGGGFTARVYDPGTAEGWKSAIAVAAKEAGASGVGLDGPIYFIAKFFFTRPKSHFRTGKNSAHIKDQAPILHTSKPDLDNIAKAAKDALTQIGVWRDDSQVCREELHKAYTAGPAFSEFEIIPIIK